GCHESAHEARIGADHGVLDRVRNDEEQHEIEHAHLPEGPRATESQPEEHEEIDDGRPQRDVEQRVERRGHRTSYRVIGFPCRYLSNQFRMCCRRSTRCSGLPERDSSCDSPGKRTITVVLRRYLRARNIASPPWLGGARRSSSPRMNMIGVVTLSA